MSYSSLGEQFEAERALAMLGALLPSFHESYWLGLHIPQVGIGQLALLTDLVMARGPWPTEI